MHFLSTGWTPLSVHSPLWTSGLTVHYQVRALFWYKRPIEIFISMTDRSIELSSVNEWLISKKIRMKNPISSLKRMGISWSTKRCPFSELRLREQTIALQISYNSSQLKEDFHTCVGLS